MTREELIKSARKLYDNQWPNEALKKALEENFPELKESDDERIRKNILALVKKHAVNHERCQMEIYLEKLKDITPIVVSNEDWDCQRAYSEGYQKGMAESNKQEEPTEELSIRLNGLMQEYVKAGKDEEDQEHRLKCYQLFWDALGDSEFFEQKEQKPVISDEAIRDGVTHFGITQYQIDYWLKKHINVVEQKPTEWSKEMGNLCLDAISLIRAYGEGIEKDSQLGQKIVKVDAFLSDLYHEAFYPKTYNPRPDILPAEWSEEDEEILRIIINRLTKFDEWASEQGYTRDDPGLRRNPKDWLKSLPERFNLQTKQEWSEDDEKMLNRIIDTVQDSIAECDCDDTGCKARFALEKQENWLRNRLKSFCPQPHWKPSEEQINAIHEANYRCRAYQFATHLTEIEIQLEKLMNE